MKLTKSAKLIRISKKSLDDYYLVLRVGQLLGFNYAYNLQNKMGELRTFIREMGCKVSGKLIKQVKCFDLLSDFDMDKFIQEQNNGQIDDSKFNKSDNKMKQ